jgi:membrane fusion protein, multidrug efflux system
MRKTLLPVVVLFALFALAIFSWRYYKVGRFIETTENAYLKADTVDVSPRVQGYVIELLAQENQRVAQGDILFKIDNRDYLARVQQAQAAVDVASANLITLKARSGQQKSAIAGANATRLAALAEAERAMSEAKRQRDLFNAKLGSAQALETTKAQSRAADAGVAGARAAINTQEGAMGVLDAEFNQAQAALKQATAALSLVQLDVDDTFVRAPIAGVIGNLRVRQGEFVRPGAYALSIVPLPHVYIEANFKETQLRRMHIGDVAEVELDVRPNAKLRAKVVSFAPASGAEFSLLPPENATGNFTKIVQRVPVRLELESLQGIEDIARPGLSVHLRVDTKPASAQ